MTQDKIIEQATPSQSVDEKDVVFPILSGGIFKHEKLGELYDRLQVHSYAVKHCQYFVDSLSKPQPTSQDMVDAVLAEREACAQRVRNRASSLSDSKQIAMANQCVLDILNGHIFDAAMKESK